MIGFALNTGVLPCGGYRSALVPSHSASCPHRALARRPVGGRQLHHGDTVCSARGLRGRDSQRRGDGRRPQRVSELIRREISTIVDDAFSTMPSTVNAGQVLVSVVDVKCSDDLRNARVHVSVLGPDDQKKEAMRWLRVNRKPLRYELAQCMRGMKVVPSLTFHESEVAQAVRTMNILDELARQREEKTKRAGSERENLDGSDVQTVGQDDLELDATAEDPFIDSTGMLDLALDRKPKSKTGSAQSSASSLTLDGLAPTGDDVVDDDELDDDFGLRIIDVGEDDDDDDEGINFSEISDEETLRTLYKATNPKPPGPPSSFG